MKKLATLSVVMVFLAIPFIAIAQSTGENYVHTVTYTVEGVDTTAIQNNTVPVHQKIEQIMYYDGLGRPMQSISKRGGGDKQDIITPFVYDHMGREAKKYLPYVNTQQNPWQTSLNYMDNSTVIPLLEDFYTNKYPQDINTSFPNPYSETVFEASPLNRVLEQGAPGEDWKADPLSDLDHSIKFGYGTNGKSEVRLFKVYFPNSTDTEITELISTGYYAENELYKSVTKDENWQPSQQYLKDHTTEEFRDKLGRVLLKRTYNQNKPHDTYYVYDDFGNLTYVIPPVAADAMVNSKEVKGTLQTNYPWTRLVNVDKAFAQEYERKLVDYENTDILNADIENSYNGQGGFAIATTTGVDGITLSINFSADSPFELRNGPIASLDSFGSFADTELGRIGGTGYSYIFSVVKNSVVVTGNGPISGLNQIFSPTRLSYSQNYPWTQFVDVDENFARDYEGQLDQYPNSEILTVEVPNQYDGQGGLNISVDENDLVTVNINTSFNTPFALKKGLVIPLNTERRLADREIGIIEGPGYSYRFSVQENSLMIEGGGQVTDLNMFLSSPTPPAPALSTEVLEGLCYIYHYDYRNRMVEKKIPGKGWEFIVYDKLDRPVLTQDAKMRLNNEWLFTKYDVFDRVVYSGKYHYVPRGDFYIMGREEMQQTVNSQNQWNESLNTTSVPKGNIDFYYSYNVFPNVLNTIEIHTINFYDSYSGYDPQNLEPANPVLNQSITDQTKGLSTANMVRVLGTDDWITSVTYYDDRARPIYTGTFNEYFNLRDWSKTKYDFSGKVTQTQSSHKKGSASAIIVTDLFSYDPMGRLLVHRQKIGAGSYELIANNDYDELGQLETKKVGGAVASPLVNSAGLQTVDYSYNIRGWLKGINNVDNLGSSLFGFGISYNSPDANTVALYNGNISETKWRTANDNRPREYAYSYDALNRITGADYKGPYLITSPIGSPDYEDFSLGSVQYDKNGNILGLQRIGSTFDAQSNFNGTDIIDDLQYDYTPYSNKLDTVIDAAGDEGFKDGDNELYDADDYAYDINGNLISDLNKGVTSVLYNHLNMPTKITVTGANAGVLDYKYSADGTKLQKIKTQGGNTTTTDYAGNYVYENNVLKQVSHTEGYFEPKSGGGYQYVYYLKDHLGNTRITFADDNGNGSVNSSEIRKERNFYPFGLEHRGYNGNSYGVENNLKTFQDQEFTEDLGLNTHEWKYRMSDPAIGRFWQIDPLTEKYEWMTPYQFSSNQPIHAPELEGLESSWDLNSRDPNLQNLTPSERAAYKEGSKKGAATGTDFIPVVGDAKGFIETFTGSDLISGEKLGWGSRILGLFMLSELRTIGKVSDVIKSGKWINAGESMSDAASSFQKQVTGVDASQSFKLNGVKFDGVTDSGVLLDAKSGMENFVAKDGNFQKWFKGADGLLDQANRQLKAADGAKVQWHFENKSVMEATQNLFKKNDIEGIELIHTPRQ
ncbi:MAG TPA: DUF6443 domain-containing protein [Salinimicrobium sp.]|nr:DUF6443 domain-containing protein [Salinimicrobium sp.]